MEIEDLILLKHNPKCQILDNDTINYIKSMFSKSNIKYKKKSKKSKKNVKTHNINLKKNKIENKFTFILNKLSESNIDNLLIEYLENINIKDLNDYNLILNILYNKTLKEINFCNNYILFLLNICKIEYNKNNFLPTYLINIIETNLNIYNEFNEDNEILRINYLKIIKSLINNKFFNNDFNEYICNILLQQNVYIPDVHYWFLNNNKENYKDLILKINPSELRDKLLLESLFDKINTNNNIIEDVNNTNTNNNNTFIVSINNIIEEFNYLKISDEVEFFIEEECKDVKSKIKFTECLFNSYLTNNNSNILDLLNSLIKKKYYIKVI